MKLRSIIAALVIAFVAFIGVSQLPQQGQAEAASNTCALTYAVKEGNVLVLEVCGQQFSLNINEAANGTLGDVNLPPIPPVTVEVPIPGPTIKLPGATTTVKVPGPTKTVTKTVRVPSKPIRETVIVERTKTATPRPQAVRTQINTVERTVTATPQPQTDGGEFIPGIRLSDGKVSGPEVIAGTLTALIMLALGVLALYAGYVLGYKDRERRDTNFMRALLEAAAIRRR